MDNLEVQVWSDIRDLREDFEAGYFRDRPSEWHQRWAIIAKKVERLNHASASEEFIQTLNLD